MSRTLLPSGCYDLLPPFARQETDVLTALLATFEAYGYAQVAPPLLEYTESLLAGRGNSLASQVFRVMDTGAHKVMGIRPDLTLQVARIAATRLAHAPLPLRLCYAGNVLRMKPEGASASRQLRQAGIELIGASSAEADAEVIIVVAEALARVGLTSFTVDLHLPGIIGDLLAEEALNPIEATEALSAIAHKDIAAPALRKLANHALLARLMEASGPADQALPKLRDVSAVEPVARVAALLNTALPRGAHVSVDLTEARGFEYYTGLSFALFVPGAPQEIGRGGRYRFDAEGKPRDATGFTLYLDGLRRLLPAPETPRRVFVTGGDDKTFAQLQAEGFVTVQALPDYPDTPEEAKRQGCTHYWAKGTLKTL